MKASEARKLSTKYFLYDLPIAEVNFLLDQIEFAILCRATYIRFDPKWNFNRYEDMHNLTRRYLKKLGYHIKYCVHFDVHESYYIISWEETWWDKLKKLFSLGTH